MNFNTIKNAGRKIYNASSIFVRKNSPILCITAGTIGMGVAIVLACKATKKSESVKAECKERIDILHKNKETTSKKAYRQEAAKTYGQNLFQWSKLCAPTVMTAAGSTGLIFFGAGLLNKRLASVISAAAITENGFAQYRSRVIEKYGQEEDDFLRLGIESIEPAKTKSKKEKAEESTAKMFVMDRSVIDGHSHYARYFDKSTAFSTWCSDPASNLTFLEGRERWLNQRLQAEGFLMLNDVYRELGLEPSEAGCTVGWLYDPDSETHMGDNYIDFGLFGEGIRRNQMVNAYLNGDIDEIIVDFNPDGVIADKIGHKF